MDQGENAQAEILQQENQHLRAQIQEMRDRLNQLPSLEYVKGLELRLRRQSHEIKKLQAGKETTNKAACEAGIIPPILTISGFQRTDCMQKQAACDVERARSKIEAFAGGLLHIPLDEQMRRQFTQNICGLPSFFASLLLRRLPVQVDNQGTHTTPEILVEYFRQHIAGFGTSNRAVRIFGALGIDIAQGFIQPVHLRELFHNWVMESTHSDLELMRQSEVVRRNYVDWVVTNVFHTVNKRKNMRISFVEFSSSTLPDMLYDSQLRTNPTQLDCFSADVFLELCNATRQLRDHEGTMDAKQCLFMIFGNFGIAVPESRFGAIIQELQRMKLDDRPAGAGRLHLYQYFDCYLQCRLVHNPHTIHFWFRVMDTDDDGRLSKHDVCEQYAAKQRALEATGMHHRQAQHDGETTWRILCDALLGPAPSRPITTLDVMGRKGGQRILYDLLLGLAETKVNCNFL